MHTASRGTHSKYTQGSDEDTSWGAETHKYEDSAVGPSYHHQKPFLK